MSEWAVAFIISAIINICCLMWSLARELYIRVLIERITDMGAQSIASHGNASLAIAQLCKAVELDSQLTREKREEIKTLILDVEKRITDTVRDRSHPTINLSNNDYNNRVSGNQARIAQGGDVEQK